MKVSINRKEDLDITIKNNVRQDWGVYLSYHNARMFKDDHCYSDFRSFYDLEVLRDDHGNTKALWADTGAGGLIERNDSPSSNNNFKYSWSQNPEQKRNGNHPWEFTILFWGSKQNVEVTLGSSMKSVYGKGRLPPSGHDGDYVPPTNDDDVPPADDDDVPPTDDDDNNNAPAIS